MTRFTVEPLPSHPNLEHQQKLAKRLLRHVWAVRRGYADIVEMLLAADPNPPLLHENEFGGIPLGACVHGSLHGWKTGFPQDHRRTLTLLLEAGSPVDPTWLPTGNDELDTVMRAWLKSG